MIRLHGQASCVSEVLHRLWCHVHDNDNGTRSVKKQPVYYTEFYLRLVSVTDSKSRVPFKIDVVATIIRYPAIQTKTRLFKSNALGCTLILIHPSAQNHYVYFVSFSYGIIVCALNHCEENEISIEQAQLAPSLFLRCSRFL